jgi:hypothetical protein
MKAIKVMGTIDENGQLFLDQPIETNQNSRVEVIVLIPEADNEVPSKEEVLADFRQAWHEAMTGQTIPISQLLLPEN